MLNHKGVAVNHLQLTNISNILFINHNIKQLSQIAISMRENESEIELRNYDK